MLGFHLGVCCGSRGLVRCGSAQVEKLRQVGRGITRGVLLSDGCVPCHTRFPVHLLTFTHSLPSSRRFSCTRAVSLWRGGAACVTAVCSCRCKMVGLLSPDTGALKVLLLPPLLPPRFTHFTRDGIMNRALACAAAFTLLYRPRTHAHTRAHAHTCPHMQTVCSSWSLEGRTRHKRRR
jgi:hypothetical protein